MGRIKRTDNWEYVIRQFKAWLKTKDNQNTKAMYFNSLSKLDTHFKNKRLGSISARDVFKYTEKQLTAGMSNATINRDLATLKKMYHLAIDWEIVERIPKITLLKEQDRVRFLSDDETCRLLAECSKEDYLAVAVNVALYTGLRKDNILTLEFDKEILLSDRAIKVKAKGNKELFIPINDSLFEILNAHRLQHPWEKRLLPNYRHKFDRHFVKACAAAGIKDFTIHDLRHTFAVWFLRATKNIRLLQEILGHASISTTTKYAHVADQDKIDGFKQYDKFLQGGANG